MQLERDGDVFVLYLGDDENRIDPEFVAAFGDVLDEVEASEGAVALVSTGRGRFFSNGLDVAGLSELGRGRVERFIQELHGLFARLLALPLGSVAAINGHCFAAGTMLAAAHDFRVMRADRGFLCLPEIDLATGQPLTPGMYALLSAKLPGAGFREALLTGRRYGGEQAAACGLVDEAAAEGEVLPRALERARELAGKHRPTLAALKRGLYADALSVLEGAGPPPPRR
jgi:enoyl-CoA hydratase/carnithine racemase